MRILSCNVRCSSAKDGDNDWSHRKQLCADVIRAQQADVICCQEVLPDQYRDLSAALPEFAWLGMIDEPQGGGPVNSVFYRRDRLRAISSGGYWLSQTPHIAGSRSWDSDCVRLCNWLRLVEVASGKELRLVNTHLDHISQPARENQARLINEDAAVYAADYPQILTGDMNCNLDNPAILSFKAAGWVDTYAAVHGPADPGNTFHGFLGPKLGRYEGKIDWIFVRGQAQATSAQIITTSVDGRYPSDHYFIAADVVLL